MKIHPPDFSAENWVAFPQSRLYGVPVLPTGNICWWKDSKINFVWEVPGIYSSHGWWVNAMILRELGALAAEKCGNGLVKMDETSITIPQSDRAHISIAHAGSRCTNDITRGFITVSIPKSYNDGDKPEEQIAQVVCNTFHQITNFHSIYPRKVHYDNF